MGLCHLRLCITPESLHEHLPMPDAAQNLVLTADARIDNRDELINELAIAETGHRVVTDSELILAAYARWGEGCPERLVGDFAFAIWDGRNQTLFCARDHFGVKPFYYHRSGRFFAFASEIRALLRLKAISGRVNETKVADFLGRTELDPTTTFYQDLLQLPAAHSMVIGHERSAIRCYWALDGSRELRLKSDDEYHEAFRAHFTRAVRDHVRSAYPIGSLLSGGLDSSSIVAVAKKVVFEKFRFPAAHLLRCFRPLDPMRRTTLMSGNTVYPGTSRSTWVISSRSARSMARGVDLPAADHHHHPVLALRPEAKSRWSSESATWVPGACQVGSRVITMPAPARAAVPQIDSNVLSTHHHRVTHGQPP